MKNIIFLLLLTVAFSFADIAEIADRSIEENADTEIVETADNSIEENETSDVSDESTYSTSSDTSAYSATESEELAEAVEIGKETASFTLSSVPAGATLLLNRRISGTTPFFNGEIEAQTYNIILIKEGFELFDTTVTLLSGTSQTLSVNLVSENQQAAVRRNVAEETPASGTEDGGGEQESGKQLSEDELAERKRRMDKIGIIAFLSVMFIAIGMQEFRSRND